jgi:hypothetical protein
MLIKFGGLIADGRGKIGGHVVSKSVGGAVLMSKPNQPRKVSSFQEDQRYYYAYLSRYWQSLLPSVQAAWSAWSEGLNEYNVFGDRKNLSGFNAFMQVNVNFLIFGLAISAAPPTNMARAVLPDLSVDFNASASSFLTSSSFSNVPYLTRIRLYMSAPVSPGVTRYNGSYRFIKQRNSAGTLNFNVYSNYISAFGSAPIGKKIFYKVIQLNQSSGLILHKLKPGADLKIH